MNRYNFTFPMKVLNNQGYKLDPISLPREFCNQYLENGIEKAVHFYKSHATKANYKPFIDFDFEEIGDELITKKDVKSAIELYKLYVSEIPDEFSWELLGNAYLIDNNSAKAKECMQKSLEINPKHEGALETLKRLNNR